MKIYKLIFSMLLLSMFTFTSCVWKQAATHVAIKKKAFTAQVTSVSTANNQFTLTGSNLDQVATVKLKDGSSETLFEIVSQSGTQLVVNSVANISVAAGKILEFIIADAYSAATFSVNFSLCDSTLNGKLLDCTIVANDRDVLSYDEASQTWKPRNVNGLRYLGVSILSGAIIETDFPVGATPGDYYVKSGVGGILTSTTYPLGQAFSNGDWFVFSDSSTWEIVVNGKNGVASFNGRIGAVVPKEADYTLAQMSDVKYTVAPVDKYVLSYSAADSAWIPAATLPASTVNATSIVAGTVTGGTGSGNLAANTVTGGGATGNIAQGTITTTEISATAAIDLSKLAALPGTFSGVPVGTQSNVAIADTVQAAFQKLALIPGDYVSKNYIGAQQTLAGKYLFTSDVFVPDPIFTIGTEAVNINYLTDYVDTFGKWTKGVGLINYMGGKVGIGKAAPDGMLDVETTAGNQVVNFIAPIDSVLNMGTSATGVSNRAEMGFRSGGTPHAFWNGIGAATPAIRLQTTGGRVGIGSADPSALLHVYTATAGATVANFESGTGSCTIIPNAGLSCASDIRLKENISEIPNALSKILALRGVTYQWKDRATDDNSRSLGFIAQEVEKVAPELVAEAANGYKQVNYANFVAVVTQAIRELYSKHIVPLWESDKKQDQEIKRLSAENKELKNRLDKLEKMVNEKK